MVSPTSIQLYLFGDTSEKAFCAVVYFLFEYPGGERVCLCSWENLCCTCETSKCPKTGMASSGSECAVSVYNTERTLPWDVFHLLLEWQQCYYWSDSWRVKATSCSEVHCKQAFRNSWYFRAAQQWCHYPGKLDPADDGNPAWPEGRCNYSKLSLIKWTSISPIIRRSVVWRYSEVKVVSRRDLRRTSWNYHVSCGWLENSTLSVLTCFVTRRLLKFVKLLPMWSDSCRFAGDGMRKWKWRLAHWRFKKSRKQNWCESSQLKEGNFQLTSVI